MTLAEGVHELLEGSSPLDLEEDLVVVISNLDVEMFGLSGLFGLLGRRGAVVGHFGFRGLESKVRELKSEMSPTGRRSSREEDLQMCTSLISWRF